MNHRKDDDGHNMIWETRLKIALSLQRNNNSEEMETIDRYLWQIVPNITLHGMSVPSSLNQLRAKQSEEHFQRRIGLRLWFLYFFVPLFVCTHHAFS